MTIEIPTPSAELLNQLETATIDADQAEIDAIKAIRERFTPYAKHNGFIQTATYAMSDSNYQVHKDAYLEAGGIKVRGLRVWDGFDSDHSDQNRGDHLGERLYLSERGEWIELKRSGVWSHWQGASCYWYTSEESAAAVGVIAHHEQHRCRAGHIRYMSDLEVVAEYDLDEILKELGKSMTEMSKKLPARYTALQARAELAQRAIAAVEGK
jgi:hypothetical protein